MSGFFSCRFSYMFFHLPNKAELSQKQKQLKLGISELNVDTELIYSEAKLGYSLGPQNIPRGLYCQ